MCKIDITSIYKYIKMILLQIKHHLVLLTIIDCRIKLVSEA